MDARKFFSELKRRKVYRVAAGYAVLAWLLIQVATQVLPFFEIPIWGVRLVVVALVLDFPSHCFFPGRSTSRQVGSFAPEIFRKRKRRHALSNWRRRKKVSRCCHSRT